MFSYIFHKYYNFVRNVVDILIEIALNMWTALGSGHFNNILSVCEHSVSFHLLCAPHFLSLVCYTSEYRFSECRSFTSLDLCAVLSCQLYLTLCNPMDCSLPGSSVHGNSTDKNTALGCPDLF